MTPLPKDDFRPAGLSAWPAANPLRACESSRSITLNNLDFSGHFHLITYMNLPIRVDEQLQVEHGIIKSFVYGSLYNLSSHTHNTLWYRWTQSWWHSASKETLGVLWPVNVVNDLPRNYLPYKKTSIYLHHSQHYLVLHGLLAIRCKEPSEP